MGGSAVRRVDQSNGKGAPLSSVSWVVRLVDGDVRPEHSAVVKVREVLERLHREGWILRRQKGSHRQFFHQGLPGRRVTVSGHPHLDIPKGTLNSIFRQAGWS